MCISADRAGETYQSSPRHKASFFPSSIEGCKRAPPNKGRQPRQPQEHQQPHQRGLRYCPHLHLAEAPPGKRGRLLGAPSHRWPRDAWRAPTPNWVYCPLRYALSIRQSTTIECHQQPAAKPLLSPSSNTTEWVTDGSLDVGRKTHHR